MKLILQALSRARSSGKLPDDMTDGELEELAKGLQAQVDASTLVLSASLLSDVQRVLDAYRAGEPPEEVKEAMGVVLAQWEAASEASNSIASRIIQSAKRGTASVWKRAKAVIEGLKQVAAGLTQRIVGNTRKALHDFPAWELVRVAPRKVPRGSPASDSPGWGDEGWGDRWKVCGGSKPGGRLIALKGSDIWPKLGSPEIFPDALGVDHPPFAYGSGKGWVAIARKKCEELGLV